MNWKKKKKKKKKVKLNQAPIDIFRVFKGN